LILLTLVFTNTRFYYFDLTQRTGGINELIYTATISSAANVTADAGSPLPIPLGTYGVQIINTFFGDGVDTLQSFTITSNVICFKGDTNISCLKNNEERDVKVQDLKSGDLVKTLKNGYLPINLVGKSVCYNPKNSMRIKERLYKLSKDKYPELKEDLVVTGCHSILVPNITKEKEAEIIDKMGGIYVTDGLYRLQAFLDDRSTPYKDEYGDITIYHLALGSNENQNYGIYANGLLVESCFIPRLRREMTLI
jgi:hypothetical protein